MSPEMQLLNTAAVQKLKTLPQKAIEIPEVKKIANPNELQLHIKELKNFIKYLETGNLAPETLARFNSLEQACEEINSNPELKKLYGEYLDKAYSKAQSAYFFNK